MDDEKEGGRRREAKEAKEAGHGEAVNIKL